MFKLDRKTGTCQHLVLADLLSMSSAGFDLRTFDQEMIITMCIAAGCDYLVLVLLFMSFVCACFCAIPVFVFPLIQK